MNKALRLAVMLLIAASAIVLHADDNCCHTPGWNCQSASEWIAGYHASRANQCAVSETAAIAEQSLATPEISATPAPTPTESATPDQPVNNCCFTGWRCRNNNEWVAAYYAFQANQCESSTLDQAVQVQRARQAGSQPVSRVETVDPETGKTTTVFTYEDGTEIIARPATQSELCEALERLGLELPDYC